MKKLFCLVAVFLISAPLYAQLPVELAPDQYALLESDDPQLAANKKLVFDFWLEVFQTRDMSKAPDYMKEDYMQHNPIAATGRKPFMDIFGSFPKQPRKNTIDNLVSIVAERDLVVLGFKWECIDPRDETKKFTTTWFDMLRIEDGKIAEHWDFGTVRGQDNPADCNTGGMF